MGEWDVQIYVFLTSALVGGERSASLPGRFARGERATGTHFTEGSVGPRTGLGDVESRTFLTLPGLELRFHILHNSLFTNHPTQQANKQRIGYGLDHREPGFDTRKRHRLFPQSSDHLCNRPNILSVGGGLSPRGVKRSGHEAATHTNLVLRLGIHCPFQESKPDSSVTQSVT
jgi:hypothetical protein